MIKRSAEETLNRLASQYKAVAVVGPRQSGKTTLVRHLFANKPYVNLENPDIRSFATDDPRGFLSNYPDGAILDEAQRVPSLFSYLQQILDDSSENGLFIITGSNNFLLQESIYQSLAGRVGYLNLLPFSIEEIGEQELSPNRLIFMGGYPALYNANTDISNWFSNYIRTYVERDVRLIKNIGNLGVFERFLKLCVGRIGQLLNMSSLAIEVGVDVKTISSWISLLETSYIAFRLMPYHENFNKRIVKMPKLYFYDTGLASALLGIEKEKLLDIHPFRGNLFENLVIAEFLKRRFNAGKTNNLYFWRDNVGNEVDLLLTDGSSVTPVEIKSGQTVTNEYFKGIQFWNKISGTQSGYIIYGGNTDQHRSNGISVVRLGNLAKVLGK
ncbi:MAG: ATP-binding protein [Bacteroidales bacterium]